MTLGWTLSLLMPPGGKLVFRSTTMTCLPAAARVWTTPGMAALNVFTAEVAKERGMIFNTTISAFGIPAISLSSRAPSWVGAMAGLAVDVFMYMSLVPMCTMMMSDGMFSVLLRVI